MADCPFCKKLASLSELPDELVWEFPHSVAFLGPWQYYQGYCILVARTHASELFHLPDAERHAYLEQMCRLAKAIFTCFSPHKLNYELLGNQVPHLHWHLFPRYLNDPQLLKPVWLALEGEPAHLSTGPLPRQDILARLRQELSDQGQKGQKGQKGLSA